MTPTKPATDPALKAAESIIYLWTGRSDRMTPELVAESIHCHYAAILEAAANIEKAATAAFDLIDAGLSGRVCERDTAIEVFHQLKKALANSKETGPNS